jgi:glucose/arabinose dehydrogenase
LSYTLGGEDEQVVVRGLRNPLDFAWHPVTGALWATDSAHIWGSAAGTAPGELNVIAQGEHYGWPFCFGDGEANLDLPPDDPAFCASTQNPAVLLAPGSTPAGIMFYDDDAFPEKQGHLVMVTAGSWNLPKAAGYEVLSVEFDAAGQPTGTIYRISPDSHSREPSWQLSEIDSSFFPHHPLDVVVGPDGCLYISVQEGLIVRIRPV